MRIFFGELLGNLLSKKILWAVAFMWLFAFKSEAIMVLFKDLLVGIIHRLIGI
ncbi:MAG: hypothetical protein R3331_05380 [Sulfurospirillaceae bacterium]|nr:hypothetical protein [Sulfurospirillaceae bacterium]